MKCKKLQYKSNNKPKPTNQPKTPLPFCQESLIPITTLACKSYEHINFLLSSQPWVANFSSSPFIEAAQLTRLQGHWRAQRKRKKKKKGIHQPFWCKAKSLNWRKTDGITKPNVFKIKHLRHHCKHTESSHFYHSHRKGLYKIICKTSTCLDNTKK